MNISGLIDRMIAAGMSPGEAGSIAAEIYAAGVASASVRSAGAERQRRYRERLGVTKRNETSLSDAADEASLTVTNRHKASLCDADTVLHIEERKKVSMQKKPAASRGTRIDPSWKPSDPDKLLAKQEGLSDQEIDREGLRFRDYWMGRAGAGGVKLDWSATWRNWVRSAAEKLGRRPVGQVRSAEPDWEVLLRAFKGGSVWAWGPEPGHRGCRVPPDIQRKHGFEPAMEGHL